MFTGLLLTLVVGLIWVLVGVVLTRVAATGTSVIGFYMIGCWLAAGFSWVFLVDWPVLRAGIPDRAGELAVWLGIAGTLNSLGQLLLVKAMNAGHKGVSWAMVQIAMLIPFLSALFFWQERLTLVGMAGITMLLLAIALLSRGRGVQIGESATVPVWKWLCFVLGALLLIGSSQACQAVPSHWAGWQDAGQLRVCLLATGGAVANTVWVLLMRQRITLPAIRYGALWAILAVFSYLFLFRALDHLTQAGMSCFVFPIGQATCMIGFALYSAWRLKEVFNLTVRCGLGCCLTGILLMAIR